MHYTYFFMANFCFLTSWLII